MSTASQILFGSGEYHRFRLELRCDYLLAESYEETMNLPPPGTGDGYPEGG